MHFTKIKMLIMSCILHIFLIRQVEGASQPLLIKTFTQPGLDFGTYTLFTNVAMTNINYTATVLFNRTFMGGPKILLSITTLRCKFLN